MNDLTLIVTYYTERGLEVDLFLVDDDFKTVRVVHSRRWEEDARIMQVDTWRESTEDEWPIPFLNLTCSKEVRVPRVNTNHPFAGSYTSIR